LIDDTLLWPLFRAVADTGAPAWPALAAELEPELVALAKRQPIGRLRDGEDSPREIVTRVLARLHAGEFATVKRLCSLDPSPVLQAWLRVLVRRSAIDFMRDSPEYVRGRADRADRWISLASLSSAVPAAHPDSLADKRAELLAYVRAMVDRAARADAGDDAITRLALEWKVERIHVRRLFAHGARYVDVLDGVLAGHSYPEVAAALTITRREVELTVRCLEDLLAARGFAK
jgi:hypothetical protein